MRPPIDQGVVLITGASSGIGEQLARQLAPRARVLILVARRIDRLEALAERLRRAGGATIEVEGCDLAEPAAIAGLARRLLERHGRVDVLINNAGMGDIGLFEVLPQDKLATMIRTNVLGLSLLTRDLLPAMVASGRGGVLNVSSGFGLTWMPGAAAYIGTKHFVTGFTEALRAEVSCAGVVVSQVCPGPVATEFESIAGNPTGRRVPAFIELSAEQCAREALAGFQAGRALIVPGFWAATGIRLGHASPSWVLRLIYGLLGRLARTRLPHVPRGALAPGSHETGASPLT